MRKNRALFFQVFLGVFIGIGLMFSMTACAADENPCSKDIAKYCKNIQPGTGAMMDCLEKHENEITGACKDYETKMGGARVEMKEEARALTESRQACKDDIDKFCKNVDPAQDGITKCLKQNEKKLSTMCIKNMKQKTEEEKTK